MNSLSVPHRCTNAVCFQCWWKSVLFEGGEDVFFSEDRRAHGLRIRMETDAQVQKGVVKKDQYLTFKLYRFTFLHLENVNRDTEMCLNATCVSNELSTGLLICLKAVSERLIYIY